VIAGVPAGERAPASMRWCALRPRPATAAPARCARTRWPASRCRPAAWRWPRPSATCPTSPRSCSRCSIATAWRAPILLRISGCPNGCSRPYLGEIALVGKAPGRYNLMLGADHRGQRLNALYRENIDEAADPRRARPLIAATPPSARPARLRRLPAARRRAVDQPAPRRNPLNRS
jgi:sulfite reductase (NADPH) hemoprotein beta-component